MTKLHIMRNRKKNQTNQTREQTIPAIPTKEECLNLMKEHNMLEHIIRHSLVVNKIALYLACQLNKVGENLDTFKVQAGALLHDITKTRSIHTHEDHAITGSELVEKLGFKSVSEIVRQHVRMDHNLDLSRITEIEVVNYADKRVTHERIVTLEERFEDLINRYGLPEDRTSLIKQSKLRAFQLEKKIFSKLDITPDEILLLDQT
ncbi:MAG: HDIG domain-containing protein [Thermodesulfobacteriota bacterium]|nr:HDIG domain-containing protein [Thermodesulfobacteriota bacterium]